MNRLFVSLMATALATSIAGCFPALEKDPDFPKYFTRKVPGNTVQAKLDGDRLYGASIEVKKDGSTYRGSGMGGVVDLRASNSDTGMKIEGEMVSGRTELYVQEGDGTMSGKGMIAGLVSHFDLTPSNLTGTIGSCTYQLVKNQETLPYYEGNRSCTGGGTGGTRVALPDAFDTLPLDERAVWLAVFLGR